MSFKGAFLGVLCGDAAGAVLEFSGNSPITEELADAALRMPGGGVLNVAPGQITDDGELTLALAQVLFESNAFPLEQVATAYSRWYQSNPFDIGMTCRTAFKPDPRSDDYKNRATTMMNRSVNASLQSEANGALMRAAPIAIWGAVRHFSMFQIANYARLDSLLSHPSQVCQDANAIYCIALSEILKGNRNPFNAIKKYINMYHIHPTVLKWLDDADTLTSLDTVNAGINIGHAKHAFTMAMYFVKHKMIGYANGIRQVLMQGGDTDTNAAICGAILGAHHGLLGKLGIPYYALNPVLSFDCTASSLKNGHQRPIEYSAKRVYKKFLEYI